MSPFTNSRIQLLSRSDMGQLQLKNFHIKYNKQSVNYNYN